MLSMIFSATVAEDDEHEGVAMDDGLDLNGAD